MYDNDKMQIEPLNKCHKTIISLSAFPGQTINVQVFALGEVPDKTSKLVVIGQCVENIQRMAAQK